MKFMFVSFNPRKLCPGLGNSFSNSDLVLVLLPLSSQRPDKELFCAGIEVVDAAEYYFSKKKYPDWERPFPKDERWYVPTEKDDPDYKETPIYEFNRKSKLLEGTTFFLKKKKLEDISAFVGTLIL